MKCLLLILLFPLAASAAPPLRTPLEELVRWETQSNNYMTKSSELVELEHLEIPLDLLTKDIAAYHDPKINEEMVFERGGRKFLRWVVNPDDQKYAKEIEGWLAKKGESAARHKYFKGYRTASPSILIKGANGTLFSVKGPTSHNGTEDQGEAKRLRARHAKIARGMADFVQKHYDGTDKAFAPILESAGFGIDELDLGLTVRDYSPMVKEGTYWVPGFAFVGKDSREIAERLGLPAETVLLDHVMKPYARGSVELLRETGLTIHNPHSQNFLVEMKPDPKDPSKLVPTGRIRLRDLQDLHIYKPFFNGRPNGYGSLADFEKRVDEHATMRIFFNKEKAAGWFSPDAQNRLYNEFDRTVASHLERVFGIPASEYLRLPASSVGYGYTGRDLPGSWWTSALVKPAIIDDPARDKLSALHASFGSSPTFAQLEAYRAHDMMTWSRWRDATVKMIAIAKDPDEIRRALFFPASAGAVTSATMREAIERRLATIPEGEAGRPQLAAIREGLKKFPGFGSIEFAHRPLAALVAKLDARTAPPATAPIPAPRPESASVVPAPARPPTVAEFAPPPAVVTPRDAARAELLAAKDIRAYRAAVEAAEARLGRPAAGLLVELTLHVPLGFADLGAEDKTFLGERLATPASRQKVGYVVDNTRGVQTGGNRLTGAFRCLFKKIWK